MHGDGPDAVAHRCAIADAEAVEPTCHLDGVPPGGAGGEEPGGQLAETAESRRFGARAAFEDEVERHFGQTASFSVLDPEAVAERVSLEARERERARGGRRRAHGAVGGRDPGFRHGVPSVVSVSSPGTTWRTVRPRGSSTVPAARSTSARATAP